MVGGSKGRVKVKKLLAIIGALIVLVIVAALVAPFLIPTDTYKTRLIALVKQSTGRDFRIAGPVTLSLLPQLALEASDVALANAPGAHDPDMMRLKKLEVQLRLLPLLRGSIELGRFVLDEPQIALEVDKDGKPNWVFATAQAAPTPSRTAAPPSAAAPQPLSNASRAPAFSELRLDDLRLNNGKVSYRDARTGTTEELSAINMKLSLPDLDSPFAAEGSATWHNEKMALSVGIAKPRALLTGAESGFQIRLAGAPVELGFAGAVTGLPPAKLGGTIDLTVPSVRGLATWAGAPLAPGPGLEKLAIKGRIDMAGPKIAFTGADIALDAIAGKGSLTVETGGARPSLKGTLALDKLDLNPYLPPEKTASAGPASSSSGAVGQGSPQSAKPAASAGWSDDPIDLSGLHAADVDFDLKAGAILYRKIAVGESALDLHVKDAKLAANLSRISLYQGEGQGKITADGSGAVPSVAVTLAMSGVQLEPLLEAAAGTDRVSGTAKLNFDAAGSGKSQRALISALNGKGAIVVANGQLKGVNLIALAESATSSLTGVSGDSRTDFASLSGTFTITNGVVKNDDLQLKSGIIPITGAGTVNLPNRAVDYRVTVSLAGAIGVPVLVSGPWDNLSYRPDLAGVLQGAAKAPGQLMDQLRSLGKPGAGAGSGGGNPVDVLKNLFGK
jgi:AsmA protein